MKSILISIRPELVEKILNGEKTIEIRKTAPKCELPIDVYIYCTEPHAKEVLSLFVTEIRPYLDGRAGEFIERKIVDNPSMRWSICNGKVVAKFMLRKVDEMRPFFHWCIEKETCLTRDEVLDYLDSKDRNVWNQKRQGGKVYAWHISDLVIFDEPKTLSKRPPQSWCYKEKGE